MTKNNKIFAAVLSAAMIITIGVMALISTTSVSAQGIVNGGLLSGDTHRGGPENLRDQDGTYLAQALGITTDELTTARTAAWNAYVDQALKDGIITQSQADTLKSTETTTFRKNARGLSGWLNENTTVELDTLVAKELGITVDKLTAAREEALSLGLTAAVESGEITQEQADLQLARFAIRDTIDRETLIANALGMSVEEFQAARDADKSMATILEEKGLTQDAFTTALKAQYEAAVQQAVSDGVITQDAADLLLANDNTLGRGGLLGMGGHGRHGSRGGGMDFSPMDDNQTPDD